MSECNMKIEFDAPGFSRFAKINALVAKTFALQAEIEGMKAFDRQEVRQYTEDAYLGLANQLHKISEELLELSKEIV